MDGGRYSLQKASTVLMVLVVDARFSSPTLISIPASVGLPCLGTGLREGMTWTRWTMLLTSFAANSSALSGERKRDRARRGDAIVVEALCWRYFA